MSVFKIKGSKNYRYDGWVDRHRVRGTAPTTNRREAEKIEADARAEVRRQIALGKDRSGSTVMQFHEATAQYFHEVGQHLAGEGADNVLRDLERLQEYFGKTKLLTEIRDSEIAKLVAWRRGQQVVRRKKIKGKLVQDPNAPLVSNATVNRSTTEVLKKIFIRARDTWGVKFESWPKWKDHILKEADERVRELHEGEGEALMAVTRADYAPAIEYQHATGWRQGSVVPLEWPQVNWGSKTITRVGKGGKVLVTTINDEIHAILWPLVGHHPTRVFTYVAQKTRDDRVAGKRYPITLSGFKTQWRRKRAKAGLDGGVNRLRNHDLRHDFATKLLRSARDLKLVQKALGHANIETTMRYAHVLDEDVSKAVAALAKNRIRKTDAATSHNSSHSHGPKAKKPLQRRGKLT